MSTTASRFTLFTTGLYRSASKARGFVCNHIESDAVRSFVYTAPIKTYIAGPAQQDFEWGGSSVSQIFFFFGGGGGRGAEACYPGKIRVLVILRYRKVDLK